MPAMVERVSASLTDGSLREAAAQPPPSADFVQACRPLRGSSCYRSSERRGIARRLREFSTLFPARPT